MATTEEASRRGKRNRRAGSQREYDVAEHLEAQGWVVAFRRRHSGAQGFDLMAAKLGNLVLYEVKSTRLPYATFGPGKRDVLIQRAAQAGASACLAHWPYDGKGTAGLRFYPSAEWPNAS